MNESDSNFSKLPTQIPGFWENKKAKTPGTLKHQKIKGMPLLKSTGINWV